MCIHILDSQLAFLQYASFSQDSRQHKCASRAKHAQGFPLNGHPATAVLYGALLGCMGLVISWAAPACNNPIFAEIVPPHLRTVIYAFDRSFESAVAASAAPLVGLLAEKAFGWQASSTFVDRESWSWSAIHCLEKAAYNFMQPFLHRQSSMVICTAEKVQSLNLFGEQVACIVSGHMGMEMKAHRD